MNPQNGGNYQWTFDIIQSHLGDGAINLIAEVGSRDSYDALQMSEHFQANCMVFEADPGNAITCKENIAKAKATTKIELFELALSNKSGNISFFSVDPAVYQNVGSSSLFQINFKNRPSDDPDSNREPVQKEVVVKASRFDELQLPTPDLLAIDTEGAELLVLEGFGKSISDVKVVIFESSFWKNFEGNSSTFPQIDKYLSSNNFRFISSTISGSNKPKNGWKFRLFPRYQPSFDSIYIHNSILDN